MLEELHVENLLLIERAHLRLADGLNVLTGETGAGKTVLAHALDLLLGGRPRANIVRPGAAEAYVEGIFRIPDGWAARAGRRAEGSSLGDSLAAAQESGELVLARRVGADGRTRAYLDGRSASVADLRELGGALVAFHGQHEHRRLLSGAAQLAILDAACGEPHARRLEEFADEHARARELEALLERLRAAGSNRERELALLEHELSEIEAVGADLEDHARLAAARERLRSIDAVLAGTGAAAGLLGSEVADHEDVGEPSARHSPGGPVRAGAAAAAAQAAAALEALGGLDASLDALAERARALTVEAQELASELRGYTERVQEEALEGERAGASALESLEERLAAVERLIRKHGGSAEGVREHARSASARREELTSSETAEAEAEAELRDLAGRLARRAGELRRARARAVGPFASAVREQLAPLAMGGASFEVALRESEQGPAGADAVEFLIAPNRGVPAGPLREIASGGELSRVMLALMSVAHARAEQGTLVFDEVDAGIGGQTARAVGERLRALSEHRQVICITHLPQIASLAERHFTIVKDSTAETARTVVRELGEQELVGELVRMLGADSEDTAARRHARELLRAA